MPDISLLVNIAEIFNVSISEIINGERKSEIMEKEVKKVVEAMSDYATAEKAIVLKRVKAASIIGLVALIIGLIMESICYDSMIPIYESIKGICLGLNSCYPCGKRHNNCAQRNCRTESSEHRRAPFSVFFLFFHLKILLEQNNLRDFSIDKSRFNHAY